MTDRELLSQRILEVSGMRVNPKRLRIVTDTSDWMSITGGNILELGEEQFIIRGNLREPRFGIDEQPKYWVFSAVDMNTGNEKIIKTVFHEEFYAHIGILKIRCYRDTQKESDVLELVRGDSRFMQGYSVPDSMGNNVRIIDYIKGPSLFKYVPSINAYHEEYYFNYMPDILHKLYNSFESIKFLHEHNLCHGDIRNDHIIIESETGDYRWIDFDLKQDVSDFDMWSFGNVLNYVIAKGLRTFDQVIKGNEFSNEVKNSLVNTDGSAFFNYRIINLKKLYPYISEKLNNLLMHFSIKPIKYFRSINEFCDYFEDVINSEFV